MDIIEKEISDNSKKNIIRDYINRKINFEIEESLPDEGKITKNSFDEFNSLLLEIINDIKNKLNENEDIDNYEKIKRNYTINYISKHLKEIYFESSRFYKFIKDDKREESLNYDEFSLYSIYKKLENISNIEIYNYDYTNEINKFINNNDSYNNFDTYLFSILETFDSCKNDNYKKIAFSAFYSLTVLYKRNKIPLDELEKKINKYENHFEKIPLYLEIKSRFAKRKNTINDYKDALKYDSDYIGENHPRHLGVYLSFISTVTMILEKSSDKKYREILKNEHIENAYKYADEVKRDFYEKKYVDGKAKIAFLLGKLYFYNKKDYKKALEYLYEAKIFQKKSAQDYDIRINEYDHYIQKVENEILKDEHDLKIEELKSKYNENSKSINDQQIRMIELMALFTALLQIVISGINMSLKFEDPILLLLIISILLISSLLIYIIIIIINTTNIYKNKLESIINIRTIIAFIAIICLIICIRVYVLKY